VSAEHEEMVVTRPGLETPAEAGPEEFSQECVRIVVRPVGAPLPIGLYSLAAASLVLAGLQLGWIAPTEGKNVALALLGFAFLGQALASILSFLSRDGTVATAMAILALTWSVTGLILFRSPPGRTSHALGLFLVFTATAMLLTSATASISKLVAAGVFLLAAIRFLVTAVYQLTGHQAWERTGGVLGLALFLLALYAAFASELEDALGRTVLPLGRRGKGKTAMDGSMPEQFKDLSTQPGVRTKL